MNRTAPQPASRRVSYGALILFGLAYLGALAIIFAPEGSLSSRGSIAAVTLDQ